MRAQACSLHYPNGTDEERKYHSDRAAFVSTHPRHHSLTVACMHAASMLLCHKHYSKPRRTAEHGHEIDPSKTVQQLHAHMHAQLLHSIRWPVCFIRTAAPSTTYLCRCAVHATRLTRSSSRSMKNRFVFPNWVNNIPTNTSRQARSVRTPAKALFR